MIDLTRCASPLIQGWLRQHQRYPFLDFGLTARTDNMIKSIALLALALLACGSSTVNAQCADVEVVFARGSGEMQGFGICGSPLVSGITKELQGMTVSSYAVRYGASVTQLTAGSGATDMTNHVVEMAQKCPNMLFVLGGYSQGGSVVDISIGIKTMLGSGKSIPTELAPRIAAIVTFGNPLKLAGGGTIAKASQLYGSKAIEFCDNGDPVCAGGVNVMGHVTYPVDGSVTKGAKQAAELVRQARGASQNRINNNNGNGNGNGNGNNGGGASGFPSSSSLGGNGGIGNVNPNNNVNNNNQNNNNFNSNGNNNNNFNSNGNNNNNNNFNGNSNSNNNNNGGGNSFNNNNNGNNNGNSNFQNNNNNGGGNSGGFNGNSNGNSGNENRNAIDSSSQNNGNSNSNSNTPSSSGGNGFPSLGSLTSLFGGGNSGSSASKGLSSFLPNFGFGNLRGSN